MYMGVVLFFLHKNCCCAGLRANLAPFLRDHSPVWILDSACFRVLFSCVISWHIYNMCVCAGVCVFTYIVSYIYVKILDIDRETQREREKMRMYLYLYDMRTYVWYIYIWRFAKMFFPGFVDKSYFLACRFLMCL